MGMKGWEGYEPPKDRGDGERALPRGVGRRVAGDGAGGVQDGGSGDRERVRKREPRIKGARACFVDPATRQIVSLAVADALTGDVKERLEWFQSEREARRWLVLLAEQGIGVVRNLQRQVAYPLNVRRFDDQPETIARYEADFVYERREGAEPRWVHVIEDAKGHRTEMYRLKARWFAAQYGIAIQET